MLTPAQVYVQFCLCMVWLIGQLEIKGGTECLCLPSSSILKKIVQNEREGFVETNFVLNFSLII